MRTDKRTKIVCTIGPASANEEILRAMVEAGMNVARLNFSHGTHESHAELIALIRRVAEELNHPVAIMADLQGPKIRVGKLPDEGVTLERGGEFVVSTAEDPALPRVGTTYKLLHKDVAPGDRLLLDDGLMEVKVTRVEGQDIVCEVIHGGLLTSHKGINLPTATLSIPAITEKDEADMRFAVEHGVDLMALSFVRNAKEVYDLRYMIKEHEATLPAERLSEFPIRLITKIEKHEAVANIKEIIEATDGIMVARGDLGIEMPAEEVPLIQKRIIDACREAAKPVIVATQMLDSMIRNPRPTRAEVSDVANAVIDHTDAVMLSGESASGKFPVESVTMMATIIRETEQSKYDDVDLKRRRMVNTTTEESVTEIGSILATEVGARLVLAASISGDAGRLVSRYRPSLPIFVACDEDRVQRQLNLSWGVMPFILPRCRIVEELVDRSVGYLKKNEYVAKADKIVVIAGEPVGVTGGANLVELREIP
jgi:pyruvate kinase